MSQKSFWQRPEGTTGFLLLAAIAGTIGWSIYRFGPQLQGLLNNTISLVAGLVVLGLVIFMALDKKARNLFGYMYQSIARWITGIFVKIDPISILKSFVDDLEDHLRSLSKQIGALRAQMRQLKGTMDDNSAEIAKQMQIAKQAKQQSDERNLALSARKAARLEEVNDKYEVLYKKMEVLYRILTKMYENSEIVLEDTKDQVAIKEQEYNAIKTSHSAIRSAMSIINGNPDQRAMFDQALEHLADDVSSKIGEMERFMVTSKNLMDSIDLQTGVFEEEGLRLLESWEHSSPLMAPGKAASKPADTTGTLDLNAPPPMPEKRGIGSDSLFGSDRGFARIFRCPRNLAYTD